jgi:hypothetical protein
VNAASFESSCSKSRAAWASNAVSAVTELLALAKTEELDDALPEPDADPANPKPNTASPAVD